MSEMEIRQFVRDALAIKDYEDRTDFLCNLVLDYAVSSRDNDEIWWRVFENDETFYVWYFKGDE